ncbi:MAG: hypothetical protein R3C09_08940 [Pirellulaceae bacterium]
MKNGLLRATRPESADEVNVDLQRAVADPFSLETSNDSLVQHEFNYAGDAIDADSSAPDASIPVGFDAADDFDEFSQLQLPQGSSTTDEPIDDRELEAIEAPCKHEAGNAGPYGDQSLASETPPHSAQEQLSPSRQSPESKVFQSKLAKSGVAATGTVECEVAGSEVAGSEVAGSEVAGSEVAGSEVAGSETAECEVARSEGTSGVTVDEPPTDDESPPPSSSLPTWWVDDESEEDVADSPLAPQSDGPTNGYDSGFEPIELESQQGSSHATVDVLSKDEEPSEEFFGLAQLGIEDHLREAEPLPGGVVQNPQLEIAEENPPEPDADEELLGFGESLVAHSNPTATSTPPLDPTSDFAPEPVAELPMVDELNEDAAIGESASSLSGLTHTEAEEEEDDSVEDYMRKLLARMRGVPEDEVELSKPAAAASTAPKSGPSPAAPDKPAVAVHPRAHIERPMPSPETESEGAATTGYDPASQAISAEVTEPFDPEKYMPRALAPERSKSLAAMRELANSSARTAIHKSTRQRHVSSILLKAVIAIVGLLVGTVLIAINGLSMNIGLFATVASFMVATVWGYDAISSIRPMLQNGLVLKPQASPHVERAPRDEQAG